MREDEETLDSSYHEKREPVIIIHGTSAGTATWWRPGSEFCKKLDAALAKQGSAARCWDGLQQYADDFRWSGYNSEYHRSSAAMELRRRFDKMDGITNASSVHVVAHSHGGNVILKVLEWDEPSRIKSIVFLGTPLYHYSSQSLFFRWRNVLRETINVMPLSLIVLGVFTLFLVMLAWIAHIIDSGVSLSSAAEVGKLMLYGIALPLIPIALLMECSQELNRKNKMRRTQQMEFANIYHIQSRYDEAVGLLKQCIDLKKKWPLKPMKASYIPAYILLLRMRWLRLLMIDGSVRTPTQVAREFILGNLSSYQRRFVFGPTLFVWAWLDWIVGTTSRFLTSLFRNMAVRRGLNAIGRVALGDDSPDDRIIAVGPPGEFYKRIRYVDLPDVVEESFAERAKQYYSDIAAAVYRPGANYVQTSQLAWEDLGGAVETVLTNIGLAHCRYYQDDWCIEKIAKLIAGSSTKRQAG